MIENTFDFISFGISLMREHTAFLLMGLSPDEENMITNINYFQTFFENIQNDALRKQDESNLIFKSRTIIYQFIEFNKELLKKILLGKINLIILPTYLNHMINEAEEFYRDLSMIDHQLPIDLFFENLRLHKVNLQNASLHAEVLATRLEGMDSFLISKALTFQEIFENFLKEVSELDQLYEKTEMQMSSIHQLNFEIKEKIEDFIEVINEIEHTVNDRNSSTGKTYLSLIPTHIKREESYYLYKIEINFLDRAE